MKTKIVILLSLISMLNLFAESLPSLSFQQESNRVRWPKPINKEVVERNFLIIPYAQLLVILPGCGITLRSAKQHFGIQGDINVSHLNLGYFGQETFLQASIAWVYYPFVAKDNSCDSGGWNMTFGMGLSQNFENNYEADFMWGPLSIGFEGKKLFFDVGVFASGLILVGHDRSNNNKAFIYSYPRIAPILKLGICF